MGGGICGIYVIYKYIYRTNIQVYKDNLQINKNRQPNLKMGQRLDTL